jgi:hypothetical protein
MESSPYEKNKHGIKHNLLQDSFCIRIRTQTNSLLVHLIAQSYPKGFAQLKPDKFY